MGDDALAAVERFVVARENLGEIQFLQAWTPPAPPRPPHLLPPPIPVHPPHIHNYHTRYASQVHEVQRAVSI